MDSNLIITFLTLVIAFFTYLTLMVYFRIEWLTGAMQSHSDLLLRIEAKRGIDNHNPIKVIWWDPSKGSPPINRKHGEEVDMSTIYVYLPLECREKKVTWKSRFSQLFRPYP